MAITNKKISQNRERQIAKDIGGRAQPGSGCFWSKKGDVTSDKFLIEDKFTHKKQYTLKYATLDKIETEAFKVNKIPIFRVGFQGTKDDYILVPWEYVHTAEVIMYVYETDKKSMLLKQEILKKHYIESDEIIFGIIKFSMNSRRYYIIGYQEFIDNKDLFE